MDKSDNIRILFLCVHNSARSQLAEALARTMVGERMLVFSAGSAPSFVHPLAICVLKERGIDASALRSKNVNEFANDHFDYVITLCAEQVCPVFLNSDKRLHWTLPDPAAVEGSETTQLIAFRHTAEDLTQRLEEFFNAMKP
jgi:arsenate reductase (thioredoxin)